MNNCTLVLEFNYGMAGKPETDKGTVWIRSGDGRTDLETDIPMAEIAGWSKIAGPIPYEEAAQIHKRLKAFFEESGVTVFDEGIAD